MEPILVGKAVTTPDGGPVHLLPKYGNRHGLVAGATGTGKTVTLMTLAEGFSRIGVPVFLADVKGDVAGLAVPGSSNEKLQARIGQIGIPDWAPAASPVVFWDLFGKLGHPVRTTVSEMGPTLLSRILELNDTQAGVVDIAFKLADDRGLLLLDLDDLRALLNLLAEERKTVSAEYGLVSAQSIGAIQRALLRLEQEGGNQVFGEPALELSDLMRTTPDGRGVIGILAADQLVLRPRLYSSFLLWLLSELFESLPEVGDLDKPRLVFVFDEAHLLFDDAPPALQRRIEQVVRIIRSKGVGVYFCSQFPDDVPPDILGQLGNRVQHALRAHTPDDAKALRATARTFPNSDYDIEELLTTLGTGEALVTVLSEHGAPTPVAWTRLFAPAASMSPMDAGAMASAVAASPQRARYGTAVDRESAYEMLTERATRAASEKERTQPAPRRASRSGGSSAARSGLNSMLRSAGTVLGREITRSILGTRGR